MTAKSILLSAGHSNADPGAVANGRREADIAVEFRNLVSFYLLREDIPHDTDGKETENYPLNQAARMAKLHDVAVEFHCNAAATPKPVKQKDGTFITPPPATGVEVLTGPDDMGLSRRLSAAIAGALKIKDRGPKPENAGQHHRLAFVQSGGVIVELFFLTNKTDLQAYYDLKWLAAKAVAEVLMREVSR